MNEPAKKRIISIRFIVTNLNKHSKNIVKFYNSRGAFCGRRLDEQVGFR